MERFDRGTNVVKSTLILKVLSHWFLGRNWCGSLTGFHAIDS